MPNTSSAKRALRKSKNRNLENRSARSSLRTVIKNFREAVEGEDKGAAETAYRHAVKKIDQAAAKGLIHKNKASRSKSRLSRLLVK